MEEIKNKGDTYKVLEIAGLFIDTICINAMPLDGVSHNFSLVASLHKHDTFLYAKNSKDHQVSELD